MNFRIKPVKPGKNKDMRAKPATPRLQYAALPWRRTDRLEIMLVSSRATKRWIIPKGWPMAGRSAAAAAVIEAVEEAGLLGVVSDEPVGAYEYSKKFSRSASDCRVEVFSLRVVRQRDTWPEKHERDTKWFSAEEAAALVAEPSLSALIEKFRLQCPG